MVLTYPMEMFVARHCVIEGLCKGDKSFKTHLIVTLVLWGLTMLVALLLEDVGVVLELTGAFSASSLGYILPALCYIHVQGADNIRNEFHRAWAYHMSGERHVPDLLQRLRISLRCVAPLLMLIFGAVSMVAGTISAFVQ